MNYCTYRILAQSLLLAGTIALSRWLDLPSPFLAGLGLLVLSLATVEIANAKKLEWTAKGCNASIIIVSIFSIAGLLVGGYAVITWDNLHAIVVWLVALTVFLSRDRSVNHQSRIRVWAAGMIWGYAGVIISLAVGYFRNQLGFFYLGLLIGLILLVACKSIFQLPRFGILIINTIIMFVVGLPLADFIVSPAYQLNTPPLPAERPYSYSVAKKSPDMFAQWWQAYQEQEGKLYGELYYRDTSGAPRLRPSSTTLFFQSRISINSNGFRGKEISNQKGNAYRIVALGESTTFGLTLNPEDKPWPELLEQMIVERFKSRRPVEVVNAGVPGINLKENVARLPLDILPLRPDMIISYHGRNGFQFLYHGLPAIRGKSPPRYKRRPLKLLADCEYQLAIRQFRTRWDDSQELRPTSADTMQTEYALAYQALIQSTRTNGIRLVLATYSMAVNDQSNPAVIRFYEQVFPAIRREIKANVVHSEMIQQLVHENPKVSYVDTRRLLDGRHEEFIDTMHFASNGEVLMAEVVFAGIKDVLEQEFEE